MDQARTLSNLYIALLTRLFAGLALLFIIPMIITKVVRELSVSNLAISTIIILLLIVVNYIQTTSRFVWSDFVKQVLSILLFLVSWGHDMFSQQAWIIRQAMIVESPRRRDIIISTAILVFVILIIPTILWVLVLCGNVQWCSWPEFFRTIFEWCTGPEFRRTISELCTKSEYRRTILEWLTGAAFYSTILASTDLFRGIFLCSVRMTIVSNPKSRLGKVDCVPFNILHISDLHFVDTSVHYRLERKEGEGPQGNRTLNMVLPSLTARAKKAHAVIVSGDITDSCSQGEWDEAREYFIALKKNSDRPLFILPGNHDLSLVSRKLFSFAETDGLIQRRYRHLKSITEVDHVIGDSIEVLPTSIENNKNQYGLTSLKLYIRNYKVRINTFLESKQNGDKFAWNVWDDCFPLVQRFHYIDGEWKLASVDEDRPSGPAIAIIGIDTCHISMFVPTNAFGRVNSAQLNKALLLAASLRNRGYAIVWVGHHHFLSIRRSLEGLSFKKLLFSAGMALADAGRVVRAMIEASGDTVILHGHRHIPSMVHCSHNQFRVTIVSAPSLVFGDETNDENMDIPGIAELTLDVPLVCASEINSVKTGFTYSYAKGVF